MCLRRGDIKLRNILLFLGQIVLIVFIGFVDLEVWRAYKEEKRTTLFEQEGRPVGITIDQVTHEKQTWKDYIGNSKYIGFLYRGKAYKIRYVQDTLFVMEGTRLSLLYHEGLDEFRQPRRLSHGRPIYRTSRLVNWTLLNVFSIANRYLFFCVALSIVLYLMVSGMAANLTGSRRLTAFNNVFIPLVFFAGALYVTVEAWEYYAYYRQVKSGAGQLAVPVVSLDKNSRFKYQHSDDVWKVYDYTALVHYQKEDRIIPISEKDYETISPGGNIDVYYNERLDDMISVNYTTDWIALGFVLFVWGMAAFVLVGRMRKRRLTREVRK